MPPKIFEVTEVKQINPVMFITDDDTVTGLNVNVLIGCEGFEASQMIDLFPYMTEAQKTQIQNIYDKITSFINNYYLG